MKTWLCLALIFVCGVAVFGQPGPVPNEPPVGTNIVLYPSGPTTVHLHGISGEVHIWWAAGPPSGAMTQKQKDEQAAIDRIRAVVPPKKTSPDK